jgi:hypothetical protein
MARRRAAAIAAAPALAALVTPGGPALQAAGASTLPAPSAAHAAIHFACSKLDSAKVPCRFSTPSGNIRCLWTPSPNRIECELLATGRGYRLRPSGKAKAAHHLSLSKRGETLPTAQQLVFLQSLSCHDSKTTMTCNQDFGLGFFTLARKGSRSA